MRATATARRYSTLEAHLPETSYCPWCKQDVEKAVLAEASNLREIALEDVDELLFHAEHDEANDMKTVMRLRAAIRQLRCCTRCHFVTCECEPAAAGGPS